jgi:hypothetical protein
VPFAHLKNILTGWLSPVDNADVTAWAGSLPDDARQLYVEIKLDQIAVHATKAVERNGIVSWDEKLLMYA